MITLFALKVSAASITSKTTSKIAITICSLLLLSACSQGKSVNSLQQDFDKYKYSDYVLANLRIKIPTKNSTTVAQTPKLNLQKRSSKANINIASVVVNNGLFKPTNAGFSIDKLAKKAPLNSLLNIALKRNLDIKSMKQQAQANLEKYNQVEFLSDTLKQYAAFTDDIALTGSAKKKTGIAYPSPGLNAIKSSIIDESVKYSRLKLKQTTQDVITRVRIAYAELQTARRETYLLGQLTSQYQLLKQELQNNYATNTGELGVILQADIDIASSQNRQRLAKDKRDTQQARLNALLDVPIITRFGKLDKLTEIKLSSKHNKLKTIANKKRVEIALLKTELAKMQQIIQLSEKRLYPDLDAGFSRTKNGKFATNPKVKTNQFFAKNDAYLNETRQKAEALKLKIAALKNTTASDLQQKLSAYQSQKSTYRLYRNKVIPKAKSSLDIANNSFEAGDGGSVKIINAKVAIIKYRLLLLKALRDLQISHSKAERLSGFKIR
ncbi:MAG: TolC family protein [Cocleimonas sp.]